MPIIKNEPDQPENFQVELDVKQYVSLKDEVGSIESRLGVLKKRIFGHIESLGEVNEKGSIVLEVPGTSEVKAVVKQRRASKMFDEDSANSLLQDKGLFDSCTKTITVLDQDAVMAAYYEGKLTDEDIETMFPEKVSWALVFEK